MCHESNWISVMDNDIELCFFGPRVLGPEITIVKTVNSDFF